MAEEMAAMQSNPATKGNVINMEKKVFYRSDDDSAGAMCLRRLRCGCCDPMYSISTEAVRVTEWKGCSRKNWSVDVDDVQDIALQQSIGPGYCLFKRGHIKLYIVQAGKDDWTYTVKHVENAPKVFDEFSSHIHRITNLKFGMKRPGLEKFPQVMYDSQQDGACLKFVRSGLCCGCWCFPHTLITKERITTSKWGINCQKTTQQFDLDNVRNVNNNSSVAEMCCGAGTLVIEGEDRDQNGLTIRYVGGAKEVFKQLDEVTNILNNRNRVVGGEEMGR